MKRETKKYLGFVEEFNEYIVLLIKGWGTGAKATFQRADKESGRQEDLLEVNLGGNHSVKHIQTFHLEDIYRDYEKGISMAELLAEAADILELCRKVEKSSPLNRIEDYGLICEYLTIRPLNYGKNAHILGDGIYELVGDIALTLYVSIGNFDGIYTSSMVPRHLLKKWGLVKQQALDAAMKNTYKLFPPRLFNWTDIMRAYDENYGNFMEHDAVIKLNPDALTYFVSIKGLTNGAVAIFLPGVARRLSELIGNDLNIAFTSIHETAVHDCNKVSPDWIKKQLIETNNCMLETFLSSKVYHYNREKDRIEVIK